MTFKSTMELQNGQRTGHLLKNMGYGVVIELFEVGHIHAHCASLQTSAHVRVGVILASFYIATYSVVLGLLIPIFDIFHFY